MTKVEPDDKNNLSYFDNVVNLIYLLKNSTDDYYNIKKLLGGKPKKYVIVGVETPTYLLRTIGQINN